MKGATVPLGTNLVIMAMTIPENSEAESTGDFDLQLGLTYLTANAGECGLRIPPVVDNVILGNHSLQMMS